MGGLPLPSEKNRQKIVQNRKRYERDALNRRLRASAPPVTATSSSASVAETSNNAVALMDSQKIPSVIEVKVVRACQGVIVIEYTSNGVTYMGVLYAENGVNGAPGIIREDMAKFRETISSYVDVPLIDQWTSSVGERFLCSGFQLRDRSFMRTYGRMVCASCMEAVPENELIDDDEVVGGGYESADEQQFSSETASSYSSDVSASSEPLQKRNKRKAYVPRGACNVLVPAGVDLFEPEYDPFPGPSSGTTRALYNVRPSHKFAKKRVLFGAAAARNRRGIAKVGRRETTKESRVRASTAVIGQKTTERSGNSANAKVDKNVVRECQEGGGGSVGGSGCPIRFKSDKIRKAFSKYTIRKSDTDSLHMTFVRQPSDQNAHSSDENNQSSDQNNHRSERITQHDDQQSIQSGDPISQFGGRKIKTGDQIAQSIAHSIRIGGWSIQSTGQNSQYNDQNIQSSSQNVQSLEQNMHGQQIQSTVPTKGMHPGTATAHVLEGAPLLVGPSAVSVHQPKLLQPYVAVVRSNSSSADHSYPSNAFGPNIALAGLSCPKDTFGSSSIRCSDYNFPHSAVQNIGRVGRFLLPPPSQGTTPSVLPPNFTSASSFSSRGLCAPSSPSFRMPSSPRAVSSCASQSLRLLHAPASDEKETDMSDKERPQHSSVKATECIPANVATKQENQDRPPIRIVLKSVKKCDTSDLAPPPIIIDTRTQPSPATLDTPTQPTSAVLRNRFVEDFRYRPAIEKSVVKIRPPIAQRRSDTGCPPMIKATPPKTLKMKSDSDKEANAEEKPSPRRTRSASERVAAKQGTGKGKVMGNGSTSFSETHELPSSDKSGFKVGDVVWAKNGTDPYWPGRIYRFAKENRKNGASVVWFGVDTYSPFIDFSRMEKFAESYEKRFNPRRTEQRYHKAVASGIVACLPRKGYFEQKLSAQVHRLLMEEHNVVLGEVNVVKKRKRKVTVSAPTKRRRISIKREIKTFEANQPKMDVPSSPEVAAEMVVLEPANTAGTQNGSLADAADLSDDGDPPLVIVYDSDEL